MAKKVSKKSKRTSKKKLDKSSTSNPPLFKESPNSKKSSNKIQALVKYNEDEDLREKYKFKKEFIKQAESYMALGITKDDLAERLGVHDATIDRWCSNNATFNDAIIRGGAQFIKSLPAKLVEHRSQGLSFESFSGVAGRSKNWLYELARSDKKFKRAKEIAYGQALIQWEKLGIAQAGGKLVRIAKEVIRTNSKGEPLKNPNTGEILTDKTYVPAFGSDRSLQFLMRAMFEEYRDDNRDSQSALFDEIKEIMEASDEEELRNQGGSV